MDVRRWPLEIVEHTEMLPVAWTRLRNGRAAVAPPSAVQSAADLLAAFDLLAHRGSGVCAWAAPFRHDPIAFLLDTVSDAANLWDEKGALLYRNRAAADMGMGRCDETPVEEFTHDGRRYERRCLRCHSYGAEYVLEIIHEVHEAPAKTGASRTDEDA